MDLPDELWRAVDVEAEDYGVASAEILRAAVESFIYGVSTITQR